MTLRSRVFSPLGLLCCAAIVFASGGVIVVLSTNQVSGSNSAYRFEPSAAVGSTWAHTWTDLSTIDPPASYVSAWNGSSWNLPPTPLNAPNLFPVGDVNLAWNSFRTRFEFVAKDILADANVWYGHSTDSTGTQWTFKNVAVFAAGGVVPGGVVPGWDYPSIGVDASGRIIIGAVAFTAAPGNPNGYYAIMSSDDGLTFSNPSRIGSLPGQQSRVVATSSLFEAFVPTINAQNRPIQVDRYESSDSITWIGPSLVATFGAPSPNSPPGSTPQIFYAPLLAAQGYTDGNWIVAFQVDNLGYNNVMICTSNRGCGLVNAAEDDEFLAGASASSDGYWVAYLTYKTLTTRQTPLITQAIYFPTVGTIVGAQTNACNPPADTSQCIEPTSWFSSNRCPSLPGSCYAAGDFNTIASNPFASVTTPFVKQSPRTTDLLQFFVQDPQAAQNVPNFKPNFIPYPIGANLRSLAKPNNLVAPTAWQMSQLPKFIRP